MKFNLNKSNSEKTNVASQAADSPVGGKSDTAGRTESNRPRLRQQVPNAVSSFSSGLANSGRMETASAPSAKPNDIFAALRDDARTADAPASVVENIPPVGDKPRRLVVKAEAAAPFKEFQEIELDDHSELFCDSIATLVSRAEDENLFASVSELEVMKFQKLLENLQERIATREGVPDAYAETLTFLQRNPDLATILLPEELGLMVRALRVSYETSVTKKKTARNKREAKQAEMDVFADIIGGAMLK